MHCAQYAIRACASLLLVFPAHAQLFTRGLGWLLYMCHLLYIGVLQ